MKLRTVICWLIAVCTVIITLALPIAAEETNGSCGAGVVWSFDAPSGTLTISGEGSVTSTPWKGYQEQIRKVIFEKGITAIADGAFNGYSALKQIVFRGDKPEVGLATFKKVSATAYWPLDNETWGGKGLVNHGGTLYWVAGEPGTSGACGDDLQWSFTDGILTVFGTGPMYDYGTKSWMPWLDLRGEIIQVVIEPGVGSIGRAAFANCTELQQIMIADSVQSIGGQAFLFCSKLTTVSIPNGVTAVDELTFSNCTSLSRIVIPSSVTKLYADAFESSPNLKKIYFYGAPPTISGLSMNGCFRTVDAVAYYPVNDARWTEDIRSSYGSAITWMENLCINGHTQTGGEVKKATCIEAGVKARQYCSVCDEELAPPETIPATGHKETIDVAKAAGCTQSGLTEGKHCSECNAVLVAQQTIPALGHSYGQWKEVKTATTEATGLEERACTLCQEVEQRVIAKLELPPTTPPTVPPTTQPTTSPTTQPTEPQTQPTVPPTTQPVTQPVTGTASQPATQPKETADAGVTEQPYNDEPGDLTLVWVIVGLTAAAAVAAGGLLAFKKFRKK